jgi:hypothetical protein
VQLYSQSEVELLRDWDDSQEVGELDAMKPLLSHFPVLNVVPVAVVLNPYFLQSANILSVKCKIEIQIRRLRELSHYTEIHLIVYLGNLVFLPAAFLSDSMNHILGNIHISKATVSNGSKQEIVCEEVWLYSFL